MYTYEERTKAVKKYIESGYRMKRTIAELVYPTHQALSIWYKEYIDNGDLHKDFKREPLYTEEQKKEAVEHYFANGRNLSKTSRAMGYVNRERLRAWVVESIPEEEIDCTVGRAAVKCTQEQKRAAVVEYCARGGSAEKIANGCGVSHSTLYYWKRELLAGECEEDMPDDREITPESLQELQEKDESLKREVASLEQQRRALEKDIRRLQMERDILEMAGEILKKKRAPTLKGCQTVRRPYWLVPSEKSIG